MRLVSDGIDLWVWGFDTDPPIHTPNIVALEVETVGSMEFVRTQKQFKCLLVNHRHI